MNAEDKVEGLTKERKKMSLAYNRKGSDTNTRHYIYCLIQLSINQLIG